MGFQLLNKLFLKVISNQKMEETGTMSKAERNEWKELAKERLVLSETLEDYEG